MPDLSEQEKQEFWQLVHRFQDDPEAFYALADSLLVSASDDVNALALDALDMVKKRLADQNRYQEAFSMEILRRSYADAQDDVEFIRGLRDMALSHGDHITAFKYHQEIYNIDFDAENNAWEGAVYDDAVSWLDTARAVALAQNEFMMAFKYNDCQYDICDEETDAMMHSINGFEEIADAALAHGDRGSAALALQHFIVTYDVHHGISDDVMHDAAPEYVDYYNDALDRLTALQNESLSTTLARFKENFLNTNHGLAAVAQPEKLSL